LNTKILDCTFRDGGYYNNWDFDLGLVREYLGVMERSGIEAVEIGFRSPGKDNFACVTDEFIETKLYRPDIKYFGVMVNANDYSNVLFKQADKSPFNFVRVATHFKDIHLAERVCKELKDLGYTVACNLMQASTKENDELEKASREVKSWGVDILYFADSFGGMDRLDIINLYTVAHFKDLATGFHGHNNQGKALNNSIEAAIFGVEWVDGTMLGMGRGAGNTETELLLTELGRDSEEVYELSMDFLPLKEKYKWGASLPYYLAAKYSIHPTFIQKTDTKDALKVINYLKDKKANSFNKTLLEEALTQ